MKPSKLGSISFEEFFSDYWKKKPLYIANFIENFSSPLSAEELAGFACEEEIESRIIYETEGEWTQQQGPFNEQDFLSLPEQQWTLLIQGINLFSAEINQLLSHFSFLPSWCFDDVMASYSPKNSSVSAHFDYYDVFILQAEGQRQWDIGQHCDTKTQLKSNTELKLIQDFKSEKTFTLNSGDLLYIPQQFAHQGKNDNESLSYSIGFRSPSDAEMIHFLSDKVCASLKESQRLQEQATLPLKNTGKITQETLKHIRTTLIKHLTPELIEDWMGVYSSQIKEENSMYTAVNEEYFLTKLESHQLLFKDESSKLVYIETDKGQLKLFVNGRKLDTTEGISLSFIQLLCNHPSLPTADIKTAITNTKNKKLLEQLLKQECFYFNQELEETILKL